MKFIGQQKLLNLIDKYTIQTLPKTILFLGPYGCGKHSLVEYLANKLNLELIQITENVTPEDLIEYSRRPINTLFLIDLSMFTEKQQNQFLKFIEEPANTTYVALIAKSEIGVLPTILNRCIKYTFEPYTKEQLKAVKPTETEDNDLFYKICDTPGKISRTSFNNFSLMYKACEDLVKNIKIMSFPVCLSFSTKINYKENYDKFDFDTFFNILLYVSFMEYKSAGNKLGFIIYNETNKFLQRSINKPIIKENFVINFLSTLWLEVHS